MTDQTDVREFLHRMASEAGFAPVEPHPVVRKALRRLARTVGGTLLTAGALVAGALVAANGLMDAARTQMPQPAGQPTPTTTENGQAVGQPSPPFTERFDSPLHGLSIGYPSGWRTRAATEPWGQGEVAFGAPDVDVIFDPTLRDDLYFALVSEPLDGQAGRNWRRVHLAQTEKTLGCKYGVGYAGRDGYLDDAYGDFIRCGTPFGKDSVAIVATATHGYIIYLHVADDRLLQATYDAEWFEAALETVDLASSSTTTFVSPRNGFSFKYFDRGEGTLTPAKDLWDPGLSCEGSADKGCDGLDIVETGIGAVFMGASTEIPDGVSIDEWVDDNVSPPGGCSPRRPQAEITIDGQSGRIWECPGEIVATVVADGRLYLFTLLHTRSDARAFFDAFAATIELTPKTAAVS
jgi:hypothetical protein